MFVVQFDARQVATCEEDKLHDVEEDRRRVVSERAEKARVRYKHAVGKELLKHVSKRIEYISAL